MTAAAPVPSLSSLKHHPVQHRLWSDLCSGRIRFAAVPAGRRSGKTIIALHYAVFRVAMRPKRTPSGAIYAQRVGFGAPTRQQAKDIFWVRLKAMIPGAWISTKSETELRIVLRNGAELRVFGLDEPGRVEGGLPFDFWVLDEYADMVADAWAAHVRPTLLDRAGSALQIGVPNGRNHWFDLCEDYKLRPECGYYHWISADIWPAEEIEQARRDTDERTFKQEYEGSFEQMVGRIVYAFDRSKDVHEFAFDERVGTEDFPWFGGMDFNVDPMTACWGWECEKKDPNGRRVAEVFIWDEIHLSSNANTEFAAREIQRRCREGVAANGAPGIHFPYKGHRFDHFVVHPDPSGSARKTSAPAGITDHTILRQAGFKVVARSTAPTRRDKYNAMNTMFCRGDGVRRVHIHPRCRHLIRSLEGLLYREGSSEPDFVKCGALSHLCDALGYWLERRHPILHGAQGINF